MTNIYQFPSGEPLLNTNLESLPLAPTTNPTALEHLYSTLAEIEEDDEGTMEDFVLVFATSEGRLGMFSSPMAVKDVYYMLNKAASTIL